MKKEYISLGLMSGTSSDGIDASIIKSNGEISEKKKIFEILENQYFEYDYLTPHEGVYANANHKRQREPRAALEPRRPPPGVEEGEVSRVIGA